MGEQPAVPAGKYKFNWHKFQGLSPAEEEEELDEEALERLEKEESFADVKVEPRPTKFDNPPQKAWRFWPEFQFHEVGIDSYGELRLGDRKLGDDGAKELAKILPNYDTLEVLDLSRNQIGVAGMTALAEAFPACKKLITVFLDENQIGDVGAKELARVLAGTQLKVVEIVDNDVTDIGAEAFAQVLPQCENLQFLTLGKNKIGKAGAMALAEAIPKCKNLKKLNTQQNVWEDDKDSEFEEWYERLIFYQQRVFYR